MILSIQHYLDAASRALAEVVSPAVDPSNRFAVEQLGLVQGVLAIVGQQWRHAYELEAIELKELAGLVQKLQASVEPAIASGRTQAFLAEIADKRVAEQLPFATLRTLGAELRQAAEELVDAVQQQGDAAAIAQAARIVTDHAAREADRARAWFAITRMDLRAQDIPPIATALSAEAES